MPDSTQPENGGLAAPASEEWDTIVPGEAGLDTGLLEQADACICRQWPKFRSLLLVRGGKLAYERYYHGGSSETLMDVRSITKSFTSAAVGLAVKDGLLPDLSAEISGFFQDRGEVERLAPERITIRHLLTMTSGFHWQTGSRLGERYIRSLHGSPEWLRFILRLPVRPELKGRFLYRSPDSHLLSCLVTRLTGMSVADYMQERLFRPLGIRSYEWPADPQGNSAGHVFLRIRSRDLAKLGQLYLRRGRWSGMELLQPDWVEASTTTQAEGMPYFGSYGYQWWNGEFGGQHAFYALGHGGQFCLVFPEKDTVIVTTSDPNVSRWKHPRSLLEAYLLPAIGRLG